MANNEYAQHAFCERYYVAYGTNEFSLTEPIHVLLQTCVIHSMTISSFIAIGSIAPLTDRLEMRIMTFFHFCSNCCRLKYYFPRQ